MTFGAGILRLVRSKEVYGDPTHEYHDEGKPLPFIASPVDPEIYARLREDHAEGTPVAAKVHRSEIVDQFEQAHGRDSQLAGKIFRKKHEASSLELFFDLFFVANLAVFTTNHAHVSGLTVGNYIGFFSILWSTWFHVAIHDVRFHVDCIVTRFFKTISFLVMTAYVGLGPAYDTLGGGGSQTRSFTGLAIVLMSLRFLFFIQYGIVLYFVFGIRKTWLPLGLTMLVYLLTGFAFLATFLVDRKRNLTGTEGSMHVVRWYAIMAVEAIAIVMISIIWRILSFRHTHLVERCGLLTLIVIGEGIIGLLKSVAYDLLGRNASIWTEAGLITSGVVVLYFIYILYFNNIDHHPEPDEDSFGSVRQQLWTLMHFPLHIAILLTVEGQSSLVLWNTCRRAIGWFGGRFPSIRDPALGFNSTAALVTSVNKTLNLTATRFYYYKMSDYYDPTTDLATLQNAGEFGSATWNATTSKTLDKMRSYVQYYIFVNFNAKGPKIIDDITDPAVKVDLYNGAFKVIFEYFYISAGGLLLMLALMHWTGSRSKRVDEYYSIGLRVIFGIALPLVSVASFTEKPGTTTSFRYRQVDWIIPIVTFFFLGVLLGDGFVKGIFTILKRRKVSRNGQKFNVVDEETTYNPDIAQHRLHTAPPGVSGHDRSLSQDSEKTLGTNDDVPAAMSYKGYSQLVQNDEEKAMND